MLVLFPAGGSVSGGETEPRGGETEPRRGKLGMEGRNDEGRAACQQFLDGQGCLSAVSGT